MRSQPGVGARGGGGPLTTVCMRGSVGDMLSMLLWPDCMSAELRNLGEETLSAMDMCVSAACVGERTERQTVEGGVRQSRVG